MYVESLKLLPRLMCGDERAIARFLTRAENNIPEARDAFNELFKRGGNAHIIGITGVPGSGKSTLVSKLAEAIRRQDKTIGIIAIDPSSPFSGGAILGDRIRMGELSGDSGIFVRSMATRGAVGGLARGVFESIDILDVAGFDVILIETVGVGQDEVDIATAAHTTVVVSAPGLGDEIQAIKAGVLEIADIHVVSKADRSDANKTLTDLKAMLALDPSRDDSAYWQPSVIPTSSALGDGIEELLSAIDSHWKALNESGRITEKIKMINERRLIKAAEGIIEDRFLKDRHDRLSYLLDDINNRKMSPYFGAIKLLHDFGYRDD